MKQLLEQVTEVASSIPAVQKQAVEMAMNGVFN
jgi:hypothetical protein